MTTKKILLKKDYIMTYSLLVVLLNLLLICFLLLSLEKNEFVNVFAPVLLIQISANIFIFYKIERSLLSFSMLFYIISNIFHFGQIPIIFLDLDLTTQALVTDRINDIEFFYKTLVFVFVIHFCYILGYLLFNFIENSYIIKTKSDKKLNLESNEINKIGFIFFILGFFPKLYIIINKLRLYINGAYIDTLSFNVSGFITFLSYLSDYGLLLILISKLMSKRKKIKSYTFFSLLFIFIQLSIFITGDRGKPMLMILLFIYLNIVLNDKLNIKKIISLSIFSYMALLITGIIGDIRPHNNRNLELILSILYDNLGLNIIWRIFGEFGGTIISVYYSLMFFPEYGSIQLGWNYIVGLLTLVPNFAGIMNKVNSTVFYIFKFPFNEPQHLGGSYIGELFYSFNIVSLFIMVIFGFLIALFSRRLKVNILNNNIVALAYKLPIFINLLWWARDYFATSVREVIWFVIMLFITHSFIIRNKYKLNNKVNL